MAPRFDPATSLESTPPFIRWTLALECPLREGSDVFDPDHTERLLRGVQCTGDALAERRVRAGIALQMQENDQEPRGFEIESVLEPLGGEERVRQVCGQCPANALRANQQGTLAGCFGHIVTPESEQFHSDCERLFHLLSYLKSIFPTTHPRWNGLWIDERPSLERVIGLKGVIKGIGAFDHKIDGAAQFLNALEIARTTKIPLIVRAYPGGRCEERRWYVEAHCGRCKAAWPEARRQQCRVCNQVGGRQAEQRRMRMGTRPYRPLREFLSSEVIQRILYE